MGTTTYRLRDRGHDLLVQTDVHDGRNRARLLVDGEEVADDTTDEIGTVRLRHDQHLVRVGWWWRGRIGSVDLVDPPEKDGHPDPDWDPTKEEWGFGRKALRTPFEPPAGTRAHRSWTLRQRHPDLWAARHVLVQLLGLAVGLLGLNLLLRALLGWLPDWDLPDLFGWLPDWDLPDLFGWLPDVPPEWTPGYWIGLLADRLRDLLGFLPDGIGKFWPLLVAVVVALSEVDRRRKRDARERATDEVGTVEDDEDDDEEDRRGQDR